MNYLDLLLLFAPFFWLIIIYWLYSKFYKPSFLKSTKITLVTLGILILFNAIIFIFVHDYHTHIENVNEISRIIGFFYVSHLLFLKHRKNHKFAKYVYILFLCMLLINLIDLIICYL